MQAAANPFGDGRAAQRIADLIASEMIAAPVQAVAA
jgi:UDP-N-acetylglucosamine 2-epimerase